MGKEAGDGVEKGEGPGTRGLEARIWHLDFILNVKGSHWGVEAGAWLARGYISDPSSCRVERLCRGQR